MLMLPPTVRIFICAQPVDMRYGFDRLAEVTRTVIGQSPLSGFLFVFRGRRGDRVKVLWWSGGGYSLLYRRLEQGTFRFPVDERGVVEVEAAELTLLLEGIDLAGSQRRPRFKPNVISAAYEGR